MTVGEPWPVTSKARCFESLEDSPTFPFSAEEESWLRRKLRRKLLRSVQLRRRLLRSVRPRRRLLRSVRLRRRLLRRKLLRRRLLRSALPKSVRLRKRPLKSAVSQPECSVYLNHVKKPCWGSFLDAAFFVAKRAVRGSPDAVCGSPDAVRGSPTPHPPDRRSPVTPFRLGGLVKSRTLRVSSEPVRRPGNAACPAAYASRLTKSINRFWALR